MPKKIVLAYSGGLETSLAIHWLRYNRNFRVITFTADLGQGVDFEAIGEQAIRSGAEVAHVGDLRAALIEEFAMPALRAGAVYESGYLLSAALSRPLIARELARVAREDQAGFVAHGCTTMGNDRIRMEATLAALAPELEVVSPLRERTFTSRAQGLAFAREKRIPFNQQLEPRFSVDVNTWGSVIEYREVLDPWEPLEDNDALFRMTRRPADQPDQPRDLEIEFESGTPVALDGERMKPLELVQRLNDIAGEHGVGRVETVEDRINGTKTRKIYEYPGARTLREALCALEELAQSREVRLFKQRMSLKYAEMAHTGLWFSELREALDAFFDKTGEVLSGTVRMRLHRGQATAVGKRSGFSLYNREYFAKGVDGLFRRDSVVESWSVQALDSAHHRRQKDEAQARSEGEAAPPDENAAP